MTKDLHELPRLKDSISFVYVEHAIIEQNDSSIMLIQEDGKVPIPISSVTCLLLGPGTKVTHAAIRAMADNGCMAVWCGERVGRFYAAGIGETRSAANLLLQARLCMDEHAHMEVVRKMYERRFPALELGACSLQQLRGMEGVRVRKTYQMESKRTGVPWRARKYKGTDWEAGDEINRAISMANAILYGVCHAAIVSLGFSPGLGFIHTGKMLSFVYDLADLYKAETTIPASFEAVAKHPDDLDATVRQLCRQKIAGANLLSRIPEDLTWIFSVPIQGEPQEEKPAGDLWDEGTDISGGINYSPEEDAL